jgi:hypothetical protein
MSSGKGPTTKGAPPTFIVIGAVKCGTTSLHAHLDLHPEISMSRVKETNHFLSESREFQGTTIDGWGDYISTMDARSPVRGESSPAYSMYPRFEGVPKRISESVPDVRLIYLVRDPVERIVSQYLMRVASNQQSIRVPEPGIGFEAVVGDLHDHLNPFACPGYYMTQVRQYLEHFPAENLLVVDSNELKIDGHATFRNIFRFLGVDDSFWDDSMTGKLNVGSEKRRVRKPYEALVKHPYASWVRSRISAETWKSLTGPVRRLISTPVERPEPGPAFRLRVEEAFGEEIAELREFTGKRFSSWSI